MSTTASQNSSQDGAQTEPPSTGQAEPTQPPSATEIVELRKEIDWLDSEILRLVKRRVEVSQLIGAARMAAGGPRIVYNREMDVLARYRDLGPEGRQLAMALLNLGRGRLGR
ncbi:chorismate mutase [Tamaricihabitans halophyticus]|uniref:Chorismate mutase n=1 Tax=Tamaricihabitans halophyticus TaxID=1262583 RepID=A0A4R2QKL6_9PSEU|nr:chorismate mutase [Tamaricihabitans halophyticus]TCP49399.1 chorismate mutase [Tamaricihabitans halophyticus]